MQSFECGAHDIFHVHRVANLALKIARLEQKLETSDAIDETVVYFAAICHDMLDSKLISSFISNDHQKPEYNSQNEIKEYIKSQLFKHLTTEQISNDPDHENSPWNGNWQEFKKALPLSKDAANTVIFISESIGFQKRIKKENHHLNRNHIYRCVQDADFLDAIGMIGVSRTFAFGGKRNRIMFGGIPDKKFGYRWTGSADDRMKRSYKKYLDDSSAANSGSAHFFEKLLFIQSIMLTETGRMMAEKRQNSMYTYLLALDEELIDAGFEEGGNITAAISVITKNTKHPSINL